MSSSASLQRFPRLWSGRRGPFSLTAGQASPQRFLSRTHLLPLAKIAQQSPLRLGRQLSTATDSPESWIVKPEERIEELNRLGITPYPRYKNPSVPHVEVRDLITKYTEMLADGERDTTRSVSISGRVLSRRESSSNLVWYDIIQDGHPIQAVFNRKNFTGTQEEFELLSKTLRRGDIVELTGFIGKSKKGTLSVFITGDFKLLSPCLHSLPIRSGLSNPEVRFRNRHLDFLVNRGALEIIRKRSEVIKFIRQFFDSRNFLEVETPILSTQAGGANAKPFMTHANALDMDMQMRVAPELYLKQLVIGGVDRVYELGKQFRNEGIDADHNPEFTTCEFYQAYSNLEGLFEMTEDMLQEMAKSVTGSTTVPHRLSETDTVDLSFEKPFRKINIMECLEEKLATRLPDLDGEPVAELLEICKQHRVFISSPHTVPRIMDKLISHFIEPECVQPTFLWGHPLIMSPLAKDIHLESGLIVAGRFELFVAGKEIVNAYEELNDPFQQKERFTKQQNDKENGDEEAQPMDQAFCNALEYGLPPTAGWGMGVDRVVQILTGSAHIRDVLTFPTMRTLKPSLTDESIKESHNI